MVPTMNCELFEDMLDELAGGRAADPDTPAGGAGVGVTAGAPVNMPAGSPADPASPAGSAVIPLTRMRLREAARHAGACPRCRDLLDGWRRVQGVLSALVDPVDPVMSALAGRAGSGVAGTARPTTSLTTSRPAPRAALSAAVPALSADFTDRLMSRIRAGDLGGSMPAMVGVGSSTHQQTSGLVLVDRGNSKTGPQTGRPQRTWWAGFGVGLAAAAAVALAVMGPWRPLDPQPAPDGGTTVAFPAGAVGNGGADPAVKPGESPRQPAPPAGPGESVFAAAPADAGRAAGAIADDLWKTIGVVAPAARDVTLPEELKPALAPALAEALAVAAPRVPGLDAGPVAGEGPDPLAEVGREFAGVLRAGLDMTRDSAETLVDSVVRQGGRLLDPAGAAGI